MQAIFPDMKKGGKTYYKKEGERTKKRARKIGMIHNRDEKSRL